MWKVNALVSIFLIVFFGMSILLTAAPNWWISNISFLHEKCCNEYEYYEFTESVEQVEPASDTELSDYEYDEPYESEDEYEDYDDSENADETFGYEPESLKDLDNYLNNFYNLWVNSNNNEAASEFWYNRFMKALIFYLNKYPQTITYKFSALAESGISQRNSDDNNFRIYSWDTDLSDKKREWNENIYQYRADDSVIARIGSNSNILSEYLAIYDVETKNNNYYIAVNLKNHSSTYICIRAKAFCFENGHIKDSVPLFQTEDGKVVNEISKYFDILDNSNRSKTINKLFDYNSKKKIFSFNNISESQKIIGVAEEYQFDGEHFIIQK
jgi:hypothetical protein